MRPMQKAKGRIKMHGSTRILTIVSSSSFARNGGFRDGILIFSSVRLKSAFHERLHNVLSPPGHLSE